MHETQGARGRRACGGSVRGILLLAASAAIACATIACGDSSASTDGTGGSAATTGGSGGSGGRSECGNGAVEPGEACDDGNTDDRDDCTNACELPRCGDGIVWLGVEACDGGADCNETCCPRDATFDVDAQEAPGGYANRFRAVAIGPGGEVAYGGYRGASIVTTEAWFTAPFGPVSFPGENGDVADVEFLSGGALAVIAWSDAIPGTTVRVHEPDGSIRWDATRPPPTIGSPRGTAEALAVDANDAVYALESDRDLAEWFVRKVSSDGVEQWRYEEAATEVAPVASGAIAVAASGGVIVSGGKRVRRIDDAGNLVWGVDLEDDVLGVVELANGTIVAMTTGSKYVAGPIRRTDITPDGVAGPSNDTGREGFLGQAVADGNDVLIAYGQSELQVSRFGPTGSPVATTRVASGRSYGIALSQDLTMVVGSNYRNAQVTYGVVARLCR